MALTSDDVQLIGEEMVKVLEPVYKQLDKVGGELNKIDGRLEIMERKQDAQTADILDLQTKADVTNDRFVRLEEKMTQRDAEHEKDIQVIKKHLGLFPN